MNDGNTSDIVVGEALGKAAAAQAEMQADGTGCLHNVRHEGQSPIDALETNGRCG